MAGSGEAKSKQPSNTAFKQQRLRAWQPLLTPKSVLPTFFVIGIIFAPIGGWLLWASERINELRIDYTNCDQLSSTLQDVSDYEYHLHGIQSATIAKPRQSYDSEARVCTVQFTLPKDLDPNVYLYYRLTNFYQNHRRYTRSFDVDQLKGKARSAGDLDGSDCSPLDVADLGSGKRPYYPCGLIANSVFNDTIGQPVLTNPGGGDDAAATYAMTEKGIAWDADRKRFNPSAYKPGDVYPPPNWHARYGDAYDALPDLASDEHFMVWMRTAGLPTFRKLYMKNEHDVMKSGIYQIDVEMNYDTRSFGGTKSLVISTTSFIGGRNPVLGIAFIAVGGLCVLLGCIFAIRHLYRPRRLGDHTYLSWNQQVASGLADNAARGAASARAPDPSLRRRP
ncbi:alkylphosphocholine resistance protein lem3 [Coemansia sp. RSA 2706]|nr:alkylphosphocholine resistance protein lem3 [Coemansia sp. RSA 2711]KAJ2309036.1 alkylphosphocholine resistance protein lem3 [Coemansia sp. RSA 2706]KAJ2315765.1 alkylphosphocholine resistance protein lem3 [Coemansia sp. RSA 2705]KAJ2322473.1 alkylphosphocholine resistance protein lem3 [Coemansia sp. RSA 2704]KAJ2330252.1 alkylphosphocholine resistance protein lem3 [Coemansia sp. RSA 2702]KAJ2740040.1 alkylphosphocholine resistance protein lem3 [Coemansia sp. Cherry 401B]